MQPEFTRPDFMDGTSADDIHRRMMAELPDDIDDMPGGFPYDMTRPTAIEKSELINFHLLRALMISYPQYAWDEWLDLHGQQVHLTRHEAPLAQSCRQEPSSAPRLPTTDPLLSFSLMPMPLSRKGGVSTSM